MGVVVGLDVSETHLGMLVGLIGRHLPGVEAWAYGSRVKGKARRTSDLDLVVFSSPEKRSAVEDLREAFEESDIPFIVDLHVWDDLPESFHAQIRAQYVVLAP